MKKHCTSTIVKFAVFALCIVNLLFVESACEQNDLSEYESSVNYEVKFGNSNSPLNVNGQMQELEFDSKTDQNVIPIYFEGKGGHQSKLVFEIYTQQLGNHNMSNTLKPGTARLVLQSNGTWDGNLFIFSQGELKLNRVEVQPHPKGELEGDFNGSMIDNNGDSIWISGSFYRKRK